MTARLQFTAGAVSVLGNELSEFVVTPGAIVTQARRLDSGSGLTRTDNAIPLRPGQLQPDQLGLVAYWHNGVEIPVFVTITGYWSDGSVATLRIQAYETMTNGVPVSGELRIGTPFTQARLLASDQSSRWENALTTTWLQGGLPQGIITCTSAAHLCAANMFGPTVPKQIQPAFTGSVEADGAFDLGYTDNITNEPNGAVVGPAYYERIILIWNQYCRTANISYLLAAFSGAARLRTASFEPSLQNGAWSQNEQSIGPLTHLWMYMMRGDTRALFTIRSQASAVPLGTSTWFHENSGRFVMKRMQFTAAALIAGQANEFDIYGNVRFNQYPALLYAEGLSKGPTKLTQTDNRITSQNFAVDGVTGLKVHVSFMAAMYIEGWRFLLDQLPASTNKTNMIAQMIASLTALEANAALSTGNTAGYIYQDIPSWLNTRTDTVLAAPYTSGTTVQISGPTSMINIVLPVGSGVTIAGVTRVTTANVTFDGTGLGTVVVNSGFPAGAASGTSINLALAAEAGGGPGLPDLAGFHPHILAWKATKTGNVADANRARTVYATLGAVPQDGGTGPSILGNKQYEEAFWRSPLTLAYLQQSGL